VASVQVKFELAVFTLFMCLIYKGKIPLKTKYEMA